MVERPHALLAPSSSHRWLTCTRSARFEERFLKRASNYADEGSLAHEIAKLMIERRLNRLTQLQYQSELLTLTQHELYNVEMISYSEDYVNAVISRYLSLKAESWAFIYVEEKIELSSIVPESFGHVDAFIISKNQIDVYDFKYGKGVKVSAKANQQLGLYAYGIFQKFSLLENFEKVNLHIYQPRIDHIEESKDEFKYIKEWAEGSVRKRALLAFEGKGEYNPGEHCRFCSGRQKCKALADFNLNQVKQNFPFPDELKDEEISEILLNASQIKNWLTSIQDYALDQVLNHKKNFEGLKLVRGKSFRKLSHENDLKKELLKNGYSLAQIGKFNLHNLTKLEALIGKNIFNKKYAKFLIKPPGTPTLVPVSDSRNAIGSVEEAKKAFAEIKI